MKEKKVIVITGCSSGFGRRAAIKLARDGHTVYASMRNVAGKNSEAARDIRELADREEIPLYPAEMDVTNDTAVEVAMETIIITEGHVDVVINNAGAGTAGIEEGFTIDQAKKLFDLNLFGVMRVNRAVLPHMRQRGEGLLMHISSELGRLVMPFMGLYSASKFALEALAESYHYELAPFGIESVIVEPGAYPTRFDKNLFMPADGERISAYGDLATIPEKMGAAMNERMTKPDAPNVDEVVQVIQNIIELPAGERPLRTVVSKDQSGAKEINVASDAAQEKFIAAMRLKDVLRYKPKN